MQLPKINKKVSEKADSFAEREYEMDGYEREWLSKGYYHGYMDAAAEFNEKIWHKESEHPNNKHPYPVLNPDGEMAFGYYEELCGWQFDRDFPSSVNMMWLDIEAILPPRKEVRQCR